MYRTGTLLCAALGALVPLAQAQSPLLDPGTRPAVWVQVQRPAFDMPSATSEPAGLLLDLGGRTPLGARTVAEITIPAVWVTSDVPGPYKKTFVGNVGFGIHGTEGDARFGMTVRLPTAPDDGTYGWAMGVGGTAEPDQIEAYLPHLVTVAANVETGMLTARPGSPALRGRFGVSVFFPTEGGDVNAMGNYGFFARMPAARAELAAGISGRIMLTNTGGADLGERTWHQAHLGASLPGGRVAPLLFLRLPLDDDLDELDYVIGAAAVLRLR